MNAQWLAKYLRNFDYFELLATAKANINNRYDSINAVNKQQRKQYGDENYKVTGVIIDVMREMETS